jgi:hypothetical protein
MARTVRSPDGRTWTLERVPPKRESLTDRREEPFFWPSLIVTILMIGFLVWLLFVGTHWLVWLAAVPLFLIWLLERGFNFARPNIRAHTDGPPAETKTWRTTHRIGLGKIEDRIAAEIESGRTEAEPSGAVLIGI